jgi:hypothetical protein
VELDGWSWSQFEEVAHNTQAGRDIFDSVHIPQLRGDTPGARGSDLSFALIQYLHQLPDIFVSLRYDAWKRLFMRILAISSVALFLVCLVGLSCLTVILHGNASSGSLPWFVFLCGVAAAWANMASFSLFTPIPAGLGARFIVGGASLIVLRSVSLEALGRHSAYFFLGCALTVLLDVFRRKWGDEKRRTYVGSGISERKSGAKCPSTLPRASGWRFFLLAPLFPRRARVFLSYRRKLLSWGQENAQLLQKKLESCNVEHFIDVKDIEVGTSFRHRIAESLGTASVFVQFIEESTFNRDSENFDWLVEELSAAGRGHALCGIPSIIFVLGPNISKETTPGLGNPQVTFALNMVRETDPQLLRAVGGSDAPDESPDKLLERLSSLLQRSPTPSVFPKSFASVASIFLGPLRKLTEFLEKVLQPASCFFLPLWLAATLSGEMPAVWLVNHGMAFPCSLFCGLSCCVALRLAVAWRFEVGHERGGMISLGYLGISGWLGIVLYQLGVTSLMQALYIGVVSGYGFLLAGELVSLRLGDGGWKKKVSV